MKNVLLLRILLPAYNKATYSCNIQVLDSRERGRGIPKMPVDWHVETRQGNGAGNDRNPAQGQPHQQYLGIEMQPYIDSLYESIVRIDRY